MGFASFVNIITVIFCLAVLVQSVRMMRSLEAVKGAGAALPQLIQGLDTATGRASNVLAELKETLRTDASANARILAQAEEIRDELSVMVGIANATADRLLEASTKRAPEEGKEGDELLELEEELA
ncbi:DUF6468 domain-containing protein [Novosphingobium sp. M1R2S20]|uniref:DUF6468 domain-containing protein n=1 Tax=Novosphingobium rhizovicinum TaxID=3228928 RepID=A0ABV3R9C7_9SPHN